MMRLDNQDLKTNNLLSQMQTLRSWEESLTKFAKVLEWKLFIKSSPAAYLYENKIKSEDIMLIKSPEDQAFLV